jgi:hypothetical protein
MALISLIMTGVSPQNQTLFVFQRPNVAIQEKPPRMLPHGGLDRLIID